MVNVSNMMVLDNPAPFGNPLQFEITFECLQPLEDDLEWKVVYVGSAKSSSHDQTLDEILVGPVPQGVNKFILQADPPNATSIPENDILGVTVILVTCSYREKEFLRVGYYVNNEYVEEYDPEVGPPKPLDFGKVVRTILADKPRVTRFPINWGDPNAEEEKQQSETIQEGDIGMEADQEQGDDDMMDDDEEEDEEEDGNCDVEVDLAEDIPDSNMIATE